MYKRPILPLHTHTHTHARTHAQLLKLWPKYSKNAFDNLVTGDETWFTICHRSFNIKGVKGSHISNIGFSDFLIVFRTFKNTSSCAILNQSGSVSTEFGPLRCETSNYCQTNTNGKMEGFVCIFSSIIRVQSYKTKFGPLRCETSNYCQTNTNGKMEGFVIFLR